MPPSVFLSGYGMSNQGAAIGPRPMARGFKGGHTTVKNYVREHGRRSREMFVPLAHAAGHAQADFGEVMVVIGGVEQKAHVFALDLPHSDACFVRAYPAAVSEARPLGDACIACRVTG